MTYLRLYGPRADIGELASADSAEGPKAVRFLYGSDDAVRRIPNNDSCQTHRGSLENGDKGVQQ